MRGMEHELTLPQARALALLRRRHPGAEVRIHHRPWGLIAEARRRNRTLELARLEWGGGVDGEHRIDRAAA